MSAARLLTEQQKWVSLVRYDGSMLYCSWRCNGQYSIKSSYPTERTTGSAAMHGPLRDTGLRKDVTPYVRGVVVRMIAIATVRDGVTM